ncbi:MAG: hypothetical protein Q8Q37_01100 [bacterium]|nr:hypothetical protein [bacterium]
MKKIFEQKNSGYIAVVTSVILGMLMLMIAVTLSLSSFGSRLNNLDFYNKQTSYFVALSCLDKTLLELSKDSNYGGDATTTVDSFECFAFPIEIDGNNKIIKSRSRVNGATTNLLLTIESETLSTISLEEVGKF